MLHHIEIYVSNLSASRKFWTDLLAMTGYKETDHWNEGFTLKDDSDAYLTFVQRESKHESLNYHRCGVGLNHIAFLVESTETVDSLRKYCLDNHIVCLYDDKYPFANGGTDYYALFVEDPDRIKVEFVAAQRPLHSHNRPGCHT